MLRNTNDGSVTGRGARHDCHILKNALAYAILAIERMPEMWQQWSDKEDMLKMLAALCAGSEREAAHYLLNACTHLKHNIPERPSSAGRTGG